MPVKKKALAKASAFSFTGNYLCLSKAAQRRATRLDGVSVAPVRTTVGATGGIGSAGQIIDVFVLKK